jgi:pantetheine-phosphate adenylyltransferase
MKTCVFAGTFDPFTKGHAFVVEKCLEIFDKVVIAVGVNVDKKPLFSTEERVDIINTVYQDNDKIEVAVFEGMLVDFMKEKGIKFTVRGLRDVDDYKYETTMARYNEDMYGEVVTLFIPTPANLSYVSSSAMRNIINLGADFNEYVPEKAIAKIKELIKNK